MNGKQSSVSQTIHNPETSRVFVSELPPETQNVEEKSIRFFLDQSQSNGELEGTLVLCPGQIQS